MLILVVASCSGTDAITGEPASSVEPGGHATIQGVSAALDILNSTLGPSNDVTEALRDVVLYPRSIPAPEDADIIAMGIRYRGIQSNPTAIATVSYATKHTSVALLELIEEETNDQGGQIESSFASADGSSTALLLNFGGSDEWQATITEKGSIRHVQISASFTPSELPVATQILAAWHFDSAADEPYGLLDQLDVTVSTIENTADLSSRYLLVGTTVDEIGDRLMASAEPRWTAASTDPITFEGPLGAVAEVTEAAITISTTIGR